MKQVIIYFGMELFNGDARLNIPVSIDYSLYDAVEFLKIFERKNHGIEVISAYFIEDNNTTKLK